MATSSQQAFRQRFPSAARIAHLASCSLGARSIDLDAALAEMLDEMAGTAPWPAFERRLERCRQRFADLISAGTDEIAVQPNASVGAYQVASGIDWSRRPRIVTCHAEFPSVAQVWAAQETRGAKVVFAGTPHHTPSEADYLAELDESVGLVSIPLVGFRDAARLPVRAIAAAAKSVGARAFVDAYQALGTEPVDVGALGCDYLVGGTMKYLLGLPGLAFLYQRPDAALDRLPELTGWFGRTNPFAFDPYTLDFAEDARRFETGTPAVPAVYAADAGLALIGTLNLSTVREHIDGMCRYASQALTAAGEVVRAPADRGAHVALVDPDAGALAGWLAKRGILISPRGDLARVSCHYYTDAEDIDLLCDQVAAYRRRKRDLNRDA